MKAEFRWMVWDTVPNSESADLHLQSSVPARSGRKIQGIITRSEEGIDVEQQINFREPDSTYEIKGAVAVKAELLNNKNKWRYHKER